MSPRKPPNPDAIPEMDQRTAGAHQTQQSPQHPPLKPQPRQDEHAKTPDAESLSRHARQASQKRTQK